jgi:uroporphyrinogen-III decarboxylase
VRKRVAGIKTAIVILFTFTMTAKERLLCVLSGGTPDQVPVSPFIQEEYLHWYFKKENPHRLTDGLVCARQLGFDFIAKQHDLSTPCFLKKSYPNWEVDRHTVAENGIITRATKIKTPQKELTMVESASYQEGNTAGVHLSTHEYLIKNADDFAVFAKYVPPMDAADRQAILDMGALARRHLGEEGISAPWSLGSVFNLITTYMDVQELLMAAYEDEAYYKTCMDFFTRLVVENHELLADSQFDAIGIQGNIANGSLVGQAFFEEHIMPCEQRALAPLRAAGKPTIYHNCGKARVLYPSYKKLGITAWETISPPNQGDNNLADAKAYFSDHPLVLIGNLDQVHFLKTATPKEVFDKAAEIMATGKPGGRFIFSTSDYLEANTPVENVRAMIAGARSCAG